MNREQAEKLLAALIFNDLDETSKAELTAYLQTDDELRYRLADLRMAVKLADDAVNEGPDPVLGEQRLKHLKRLAKADKAKMRAFRNVRLLAIAAVLMFAFLLVGTSIFSFSGRRTFSKRSFLASDVRQYRSKPASRPALRSPPAVATAPAISNSPVVTHTDGDGVHNMLFNGREGRVGGMGGMGGMASDKKDNSGTNGMMGGMGDSNADMPGKQVATASEASERNRDFYAGVKIQGQQVAPSDAPATPQPDSQLPAALSPSAALPRSLLRSPARRSKSKEVQSAPMETAAGPSSSMEIGKEILNRQIAADEERVLRKLEEQRAAARRETVADTIARSPLGGPAPRMQERQVAKDAAGKPVTMESESTLRLGRGLSDKETDAGGGIYQGPRGNRAAEPPAKADMLTIAGTVSNGAANYDRTAPYGWKGTIAPEKSAAPVFSPAPSAPVATDVKKADQLSETLSTTAPTEESTKRVAALGDVPLVGGLFRGSPAGGKAISGKIEELGEKELAEQKRVDAAKALSDLHTQPETDRQDRINELTERTKAYWKQQQYEAALGQLDALLAIDPLNDKALTEKQMVQDMIHLRKQMGLDQLSSRQRTEMFMGADEAMVPYADEITYPKNWREMIQKPTRKPEAPFQLDPANALVYKQLNMEVDLSGITAATPLNAAVEIIRKSVDPPLNVVVLWRDLSDTINRQPTDPVNMDGLPKIRLGKALDNLVKAISDPIVVDHPVQYIVDKGVVTIAATPSERSGGAAAVQEDPRKAQGQLLSEDADGLPSPSHFKVVPVNPWVLTDRDALSTFALDVDTASYALCRRYIRNGYLPPIGAVRMEEFINAFDYAYPQRDDQPFTVYAEGTPSPFAPVGQNLTLLKVAVKARTVGRDQRRAANLVFVVDASASMGQADRLPQVQAAANQLVDKLSEADRVSLITCANDARLHLEVVPARQKDAIHETINAIQPAGPTNLLAGLKLGYAMARKNFVAGQTNEIVLCSDGVANVGQTEAEAMLQEVAQDRKQAITLTCVGVGYGAYNDAFLEALANQGDGRYVFLDSSEQAQEALVGQLAASLENVASDARIQVQFNPNRVRRYRLIGYENRDIEDKRFRDDTVDAGAVGSGQCSTALYELELMPPSGMGVPPMQHRQDADATTEDADLGTVFVRYRNAETGQMEEISRPLADSIVQRRSVEEDPRLFLAAGAARFAEWLRQSEHAQNTALPEVQRLLDQVSAAVPLDRDVQELAALAHQAEGLPRAPEATPAPEVQK